jgi:hypothetical protein
LPIGLFPSEPKTPERVGIFKRVTEGMTRDQVIATVGAPPGDYSTQPFFGPGGAPRFGTQGVETWEYDDARLIVQFRDGRALVVKVQQPFPPPYKPRRP